MRFNPLPAILVVAVVISAIWFGAWRAAPPPRAAARAGAHAARQPLAKVQSRSLQVGANELLVLEVPSLANPDLPLVENQRCYVWRDLEFHTSTITCPRDAGAANYDGPEADLTARP